MSQFSLGLDSLMTSGENLKGFYIGRVVDDGSKDFMGRIKARIENLFGSESEGIKDSDLPWIQMMPSCGLYVRPQKDDFVTIMFQGGSIYEGFYVGHTVNMKSKSKNEEGGTFGNKLNDEFFFNFHNSFMRGKYDGSEFELNVNKNTTIKIDGEGNVNIDCKSDGNIKVTNKGNTVVNTEGDTSVDIKGNTSLKTGGNLKVTTTGSTDIESTGDVNIKSKGSVKVESTGMTDINSVGNMTLSPTAILKINKQTPAIPGMGPFCCLPNCLIVGPPQTGNMVA